MQLKFDPVRSDTPLSAAKQGDVLTLNGMAFDFSALQEGDVLSCNDVSCEWLASDVTRLGGALHLTLILPHAADAPYETRFPAVLEVVEDGPIPLPPFAAGEGEP